MERKDGRAFDALRSVKISTDFVKFAAGSCLIECGDTKVLCCASIEERTPPHVPEGEGWVTAEVCDFTSTLFCIATVEDDCISDILDFGLAVV